MGEIADQLIDDEMFGSGYYEREHTPKKGHYKRTPAEKKIASIRKEIAINIKSGMGVQEARRNANIKYGKGWRERGLVVNSDNQWTDEELKEFI